MKLGVCSSWGLDSGLVYLAYRGERVEGQMTDDNFGEIWRGDAVERLTIDGC